MQAIAYVDTFLRLNSKVEECTLRLIGITAIFLAVKINEDRLLSVDQCVRECNSDYSADLIIKTEKILLLNLNFKTNLPTSLDFAQFFLYLSDENFDFGDLVNESMSFIYVALLGKSYTNSIPF
jgi:Cyclin, N-terminal domain